MMNSFNQNTLYPWAGKPSIYEYIVSALDDEGRLRDAKLPDDEEYWAGHAVRWVAGGMDGTFSHHAGGQADTAKVQALVQLLVKQSRSPGNKTRRATYLKLMQEEVLSVIDPLLESLRERPGVVIPKLYQEAEWFARYGAHRNVVKLGIALLGQFETERHRELVVTLGKHDEFTLYSAVAIRGSLEHANETLFELAKAVDGWGKIQLVERLEPQTQEIRDWLLRHGCRNSVMNEYLACYCARNGGLAEALAHASVDLELYDGAGVILSALLAGGPAENIDDYEDAALAVSDFLRHSQTMCINVAQLSVVMDIYDFLNEDGKRWERRYDRGWSGDLREACKRLCDNVIRDEGWPAKVWEGIRSQDSTMRQHAIHAAKRLRMDIWEVLFGQLPEHPLDSHLYYQLAQTEEPERMDRLVRYAEAHLPLDEIASGPQDEIGYGEPYAPHQCLQSLLQALDVFEGRGTKLVAAGLRSPATMNRNMALKCLETWPLPVWGEEVTAALQELTVSEPNEQVKERIAKLLQEKELTAWLIKS
ncbi:limonene hydroxylase [Paenibacillus ehimensis]|uniref:limonene hydroxylase n=1 Tax=Paenibacillus ehimensis TaxID=79264 RepID=UPI002DBF6284|nr:limonene hydroxylase [Paenibacillus ehimensis]MEC0207422.1 limonene hydroxylase [Paenibacillus ehimensis]